MSIGFKGGVSLAQTGLTGSMLPALGAALTLAFVIPAYSYAILRTRLNAFDAAAVAATYGSVSAVTFITAAIVSTPPRCAVAGSGTRRKANPSTPGMP